MLWTDEETRILKQMYDRGVSLKDMVAVLNRSEDSIRCKLGALGLPIKQIRNINYELLNALLGTDQVEL